MAVYRPKRKSESSKFYVCEFVYQGKRFQESTGATSKTVAKEYEKRRKAEMERAAAGLPTDQKAFRIRTVADVIEPYLEGYKLSHRPQSILFQPPTTFKAGSPKDFTVGEISEKFKKDFRVWIIRTEEGFYALFAKCTHLGCTPRWLAAETKFKCPCHGSGYYKSGVNFEGPAPRPMDRVRITKAEDGQIVVDVSVKYIFGTWDKPGAFLKA